MIGVQNTARRGLWGAMVFVTVGVAMSSAFGQSPTSPNGSAPSLRATEAEPALRQDRRLGPHVRYYVDESGTPTLTNRHELYRANPKFEERIEKYEPVIRPDRYKFYGSAKKYSGDDVTYLVRRYATRYRLEDSLVYAVIRAESNFNPYAVSRSGARGLMQLMPGTAAEMGVNDIFDPAENIAGGTQYLSALLRRFKGNVELALAGYNAGPETVVRYGGVPPYKETQNYVARVKRFREEFARGGGAVRLDARGDKPASAYVPAAPKNAFVVHFTSGTTQPADKVTDQAPYYFIEFAGSVYTIRKDLVAHIEKT